MRLFLGFVTAMGMAASTTAQDVEPANFHHVHLNVTDPQASMAYYARVFGAVPVKFRNSVDALFTERSFILMNEVDEQPDPKLNTGLWHIGWGGVDVKSLYEWWNARGVEFQTPLTPLPGNDNYYMYFSGPDKELIEVNTMGHHRFGHVHLWADDVNETTNWYTDHLGFPSRSRNTEDPGPGMESLDAIWMNGFRVDNVLFLVFEKPDPAPSWWTEEAIKAFEPTEGRPIDHIAFSYRDIAPVYERMKAAGVQIKSPIEYREEYKMNSFFVMGPDKVLIEVVEAKPLPEGLWDEPVEPAK